jgi:hypothetical protein
MVHPAHLTAESLGQEILKQMEQRKFPSAEKDYGAIPLTGLDNITRRVIDLCGIPARRHSAISQSGVSL